MVKKRVLKKKPSQTKNNKQRNRGREDMTIDTPITAK